MRPHVNLLVLGLAVLTAMGLLVLGVRQVRHQAALQQCGNNLRQFGWAIVYYHDMYKHYPTGTVRSPRLPPEKRLSWVVEVFPHYMEGGWLMVLDKDEPWYAAPNYPPRSKHRTYTATKKEVWDEHPFRGGSPLLHCPAGSPTAPASQPTRMPYPGVAGVGATAAEHPRTDPRAGFFGYDREVRESDLKDGAATTVILTEATDGGPWTAGGRATVRGLFGDRDQYLTGGPFSSSHRGVINLLFADVTVRPVSTTISPDVVEALATLAGGDEVGTLDP